MDSKPHHVGYAYPINKEEAEQLLKLMDSPEWQIFMRCIKYEADMYTGATLSIGFEATALEKFRYYQALAHNIPRIPAAIREAAQEVLDSDGLDSVYDSLFLE